MRNSTESSAAQKGDGVTASDMNSYSAAARLERLPISSFHREIMWSLGFVFFFEVSAVSTFANAMPVISKQWHLTASTNSFVIGATFFGMFIGSTTAGWFSDHIGRKRALIYFAIWYAGFSLLNAFVWETVGLLVTRMLTGIGLSAIVVVGITYISEMFPANKRGTFQGYVMLIGLCGIPITGYVAYLTIHELGPWAWRLVFVWGSLGALFVMFAGRLEESPRWFATRGRTAEAEAALDRIEARVQAEKGILSPPQKQIQPSGVAHTYRDLFAPAYLRQTIVVIVAWVAQTLGFYGFLAWVPWLLGQRGFSPDNSVLLSSIMQLGVVPGALLAAVLSDRFERKWLIAAVALGVGAFGVPYGMSSHPVPIIIFGFLVATGLQMFAPLLYAYTPEAYPTDIRNSGVGLAYGLGRLANAVGPMIIAFIYTRYGYVAVFVYIALCWSAVAITIGGFGVRTRGRSLEMLSEVATPTNIMTANFTSMETGETEQPLS